MQRTVISIGLVIALFFAIAGGVCFGCTNTMPKASAHGCCHTTKCPKPGAPAHQHCSAPAQMNLANVHSVMKVLSGELPAAAQIADRWFITPPLHSRPVADVSQNLSTPDLCLLNSVLTI